MLSVLFNDPNLFGYVRNTWSLRSLAKKVSYRRTAHPNQFQTPSQMIIKDMDIRCNKRQKLELEHGPDYDEVERRK